MLNDKDVERVEIRTGSEFRSLAALQRLDIIISSSSSSSSLILSFIAFIDRLF
jgi:hypothetical protein